MEAEDEAFAEATQAKFAKGESKGDRSLEPAGASGVGNGRTTARRNPSRHSPRPGKLLAAGTTG